MEDSLKLRCLNRSYKELMTKCNILGRGEARYSKQLEKAKEKIINLKVLLDAYNLIGKVFLWPLDC